MIQLPLCADRCSAPPGAPDRPFLCVNVLLFFVFDSAVTKSKEKYVFLLFLFLFFSPVVDFERESEGERDRALVENSVV